jgi:ribonuclease-3 family protein
LLTILTEEELGVFKRARNAKKTTRAKHASVSQYNKSTGFEALVGYLYLTGQEERLKQIVSFEVQEEEEYEG